MRSRWPRMWPSSTHGLGVELVAAGGEGGHLGLDPGLLDGGGAPGVGLGVGDHLLGLGLRLRQRGARLLLGRRHQDAGLLVGLGHGGVGRALGQQEGALHGLAGVGVLPGAQLLQLGHHGAGPALGGRRLRLHRLDAPRQLGEEAADLLGVVSLSYGAELHAGDRLRAELHQPIVRRLAARCCDAMTNVAAPRPWRRAARRRGAAVRRRAERAPLFEVSEQEQAECAAESATPRAGQWPPSGADCSSVSEQEQAEAQRRRRRKNGNYIA